MLVVRVPLSLRIARLLLFAAAAASLALMVAIAGRAAFFSPILLILVAPAVLFAAAHRAVGTDPRRGRMLALAGAAALASLAVLVGFGAGDLSFPAAGIGALAAWAAWLHPPRRPVVLLFIGYLAVGVVTTALRGGGVFMAPLLLGSALIWPATLFFLAPFLAGAPIFAGFGAALAFAAFSLRDRIPRLHPAVLLASALTMGGAAVALNVATAYAQTNTSARQELDPLALTALFVAAVAATLGLLDIPRTPVLASCAIVAGVSILALALISRPTVSCERNGVGTSPGGPWWLGVSGGPVSARGGGSSTGRFTGEINRSDGVTIRYACDGETLSEFVVERR
jgi:hypothetical protein